ncbi:T9SS type B sorting domain-containing protein [Psychroserpens sp. BH13MA-6]
MNKTYFLVIATLLLAMFSAFTQNTPPTITVSGDQDYCASAPMPIVTSVVISDPDVGDATLENAFVQISEGYSVNQDILVLDGTFPNITATWNVAEGKLTLEGPATFTEFEAAISSVTFQTTQVVFTQDKFFSINLGDANFLPSTGHYYLYVSDPGITWTTARNNSETQTYFGLQGYLATLTNAEEAQFAGEQSPGLGWIGANDAETEGTWKWVTGPEAGQTFWIGQFNGGPPNDEYSNWNVGEPNNFGNEDYAHITDPSIGNIGSWNDLPNQGDPSGPGNPYYPKGYLVEFGGMPGDPEINLSASTSIITPRIETSSNQACGEGTSILSVNTNTPNVLWFASETASEVLNSGDTYEVALTETTTFWVMPLFDNCSNGARFPITANYVPSPDALDVTIADCDDAIQDGFIAFNLSLYFEDITNGVTQERNVKFFENADLTDEILESESYINTTNPQTIYAQVIDTASGCTSTAEVLLRVNMNALNSAILTVCDDNSETGVVSFDLSQAETQILADNPQNLDIAFYETYDDAFMQVNVLPTNFTNTMPYNQVIYARTEDNGDCYGITQVELVVNPLPNINDQEVLLYCLNSFPQTITLSGGIEGDIPNNYYYNWSTGETTIAIEVNEVGTYTVEVAFVNGCSKTKTIIVEPSNIATVETVIVEDLNANNVITVLVSGEGVYEYAINDSFGPYQASNTFSNLEAGIYTVYVKDTKNDCGIVSEDVSVIGYPKFFTPNGDTFHDTWQLKGVSEQFQPNSKVFIFDRFGKLLYTLNSPFDVWDGTFQGQPLPSSDYWFSATLEDGRTFKSHFTLKR